MEIPTIKRSQRLSYEQGGAPMDVDVAASKGRAIASFGETVGGAVKQYAQFEKLAKDTERNNAIKDSNAEFDIFKANFDRYAKDNDIAGNTYREEYEKQYSQFHDTITQRHSKYAGEVSANVKGLFASNLGDVQTQGSVKWAKDLEAQSNATNKKHIIAIQQNPSKYNKHMMDMAEGMFQRVEIGEITTQYANEKLNDLGKEATVAAVNGYVMGKNYRAAKDFLRQEEVASMLGAEDRVKMMEEVEKKEAEDYNRIANREDRDYNLKMRALDASQNQNFANLLQTTLHANTPEQVQLIEKDILKQAKVMGLSGAQAKGLLQQTDDRWKEIDGASDFKISKQLADMTDVGQLDKIERQLVKHVAGKEMLHDTGTKWFNVIRGLRNQQKVDPRTVVMTKAYAVKLKGYLPTPNPLTGAFSNQDEQIRYSTVMSDYMLQTAAGSSPEEAYNYSMKKHRNILLGTGGASLGQGPIAGEYSSTLGKRVKTFQDLNKLMLQIDKNKKNAIYSPQDIKKMEQEAYELNNMLLIEEDLKNVGSGAELLDNVFSTPASQELSTPARRK